MPFAYTLAGASLGQNGESESEVVLTEREYHDLMNDYSASRRRNYYYVTGFGVVLSLITGFWFGRITR